MSPLEAARGTLDQLEGAFALAFLFEGQNDLLIAARRGSPLVIGIGEDEMYVGSDAIALAPLTDQLIYLDEGDCAVLTRSSVDIFDAQGTPVTRPVARIGSCAGKPSIPLSCVKTEDFAPECDSSRLAEQVRVRYAVD